MKSNLEQEQKVLADFCLFSRAKGGGEEAEKFALLQKGQDAVRYIFFLLLNVFKSVYHLFCRFQQGGASSPVALLLTPERQVTILHLEFRAVAAKVFRDMCS